MENPATMSRPEEITQSLPIPDYKMGWIVGKQGSYISQLSRKSGATISISESSSREFGIVWKYVQITGSGRAVDRAKKLLHIRLDRLDPKNFPHVAMGKNTDSSGVADNFGSEVIDYPEDEKEN